MVDASLVFVQSKHMNLQVCRASGQPRKIWLTRHGESEYNQHGKLGGDPPISDQGHIFAEMLPGAIEERTPVVSRTCPLHLTGNLQCTQVTCAP